MSRTYNDLNHDEKKSKFKVELDGVNLFVEKLLKEEDSDFENIIFDNIKHINTLNALMLQCKERLKRILPEWAWKS